MPPSRGNINTNTQRGSVGSSQIQRTSDFDERKRAALERVQQNEDIETNISPDELRATQNGFTLTGQAAKQEAVQDFQSNPDIDTEITPSDVQLGPNGPQLTPQAQRQEALTDIRAESDFQTQITTKDLTKTESGGFGLTDAATLQEGLADFRNNPEIQTEITREDITQTDSGVALTPQAKRQEAARDIEASDGTLIDVQPSQIVQTDQGFGLTPQAKKQNAAAQIESRSNVQSDISLSELVQADSGGFKLSTQAKKEELSASILAKAPEGVTQSDVRNNIEFSRKNGKLTATVPGIQITKEISEQKQRKRAVQNLRDQFPVLRVDPSDVNIKESGKATLTGETKKRLVTRKLREQTGADLLPSDFTTPPEGINFTRSGRKKLAATNDAAAPFDFLPNNPDQRLTPAQLTVRNGSVQLKKSAARKQFAAQARKSTGARIGPSDVVFQNGAPQLSNDALAEVAASGPLEQALNVDIAPGDPDQRVKPEDVTAQGGNPRLVPIARKERAAKNLNKQLEQDGIMPSDFRIMEGGDLRLENEARRELAARNIDPQIPGQITASDINVTDGPPSLDAAARTQIQSKRIINRIEEITGTNVDTERTVTGSVSDVANRLHASGELSTDQFGDVVEQFRTRQNVAAIEQFANVDISTDQTLTGPLKNVATQLRVSGQLSRDEFQRAVNVTDSKQNIAAIEQITGTDIQTDETVSGTVADAANRLRASGDLSTSEFRDFFTGFRTRQNVAAIEEITGNDISTDRTLTGDVTTAAGKLRVSGELSREGLEDVLSRAKTQGNIAAIEEITGADVSTDQQFTGSVVGAALELTARGEINREQLSEVRSKVAKNALPDGSEFSASDVTFTERGRRNVLAPTIEQSAQRREIAEDFNAESSAFDIQASDVSLAGEGVQIENQALREGAAATVEGFGASAFAVNRENGQVSVSLTEDAKTETVRDMSQLERRQLAQSIPGVSTGNLSIAFQDGSLTEFGQEQVRAATTDSTTESAGVGVGAAAAGLDVLPSTDRQGQQVDVSPQNLDRALTGLGFEGVGTEQVRVPDTAGTPNLQEQQAQTQVNNALAGLGFEGVGTGIVRLPDAPGRTPVTVGQRNPFVGETVTPETDQGASVAVDESITQDLPEANQGNPFTGSVSVPGGSVLSDARTRQLPEPIGSVSDQAVSQIGTGTEGEFGDVDADTTRPEDFDGTTQQTAVQPRRLPEPVDTDQTLAQTAGGVVADSIETAQNSPLAGVIGGIADASAGATEFANENIVTPAAEVAGDVGGVLAPGLQLLSAQNPTVREFAPQGAQQAAQSAAEGLRPEAIAQDVGDVVRGESLESEQTGAVEERIGAFSQGAGQAATALTVGAPAEVAGIGNTALEATEFTGEAVERQGLGPGLDTASAAAVTTGQTVARQAIQQAQQQPFQFSGQLAGGAIVGPAVSPFRLRGVEVPTRTPSTLARPTRPNLDVNLPGVDSGISANRPRVEADISTQRAAEGIDGDAVDASVELRERGGIDVSRPSVDLGRASVDASGPGLERPDSMNVRGLRVEMPPILQPFTSRGNAGRTIFGSRGARPTLGTPEVDGDNIDFGRLGRENDPEQTFNPVTEFETDVFRTATGDAEQRSRLDVARDVARFGSRKPIPNRDLSAERTVERAQDVPEGIETEVVEAIQDIDGRLKGSAAIAEQAENFRPPRDLDLIVPDESAARKRLAEPLEGTGKSVNEVFDLAEAEGIPDPGQELSLGGTAREPLQTEEGIPINPIEEELVRKVQGGAGNLREPGFPEPSTQRDPGDPTQVDVGAKPTGDMTRIKDVVDTEAILRTLANEETGGLDAINPFAQRRVSRARGLTREFENTFSQESEQALEEIETAEFTPRIGSDTETTGPDQPLFRQFTRGERAEVGAGRPIGGRETGRETTIAGESPDLPGTRRRDSDGDSRRTQESETSGRLFGSPFGVGAASGTSPSASAESRTPRPTDTFGDVFGSQDSSVPDTRDTDSPFPSSPGSRQPSDSDTVFGSFSQGVDRESGTSRSAGRESDTIFGSSGTFGLESETSRAASGFGESRRSSLGRDTDTPRLTSATPTDTDVSPSPSPTPTDSPAASLFPSFDAPSDGPAFSPSPNPSPSPSPSETPSPGPSPSPNPSPSPSPSPGPNPTDNFGFAFSFSPSPSPSPEPEITGTQSPAPFGFGGPEPGGNRRLERGDDDDEDRGENPFGEIAPEGTRFSNPVASGSQFLFGAALGDSVGGDAVSNELLPFAEDRQGNLTGDVEPFSDIGQRAQEQGFSLLDSEGL